MREYVQTHGATADAVMTRRVIRVTADTSIASIVNLFERHRIKRVL